jgi:hypothetical protein
MQWREKVWPSPESNAGRPVIIAIQLTWSRSMRSAFYYDESVKVASKNRMKHRSPDGFVPVPSSDPSWHVTHNKQQINAAVKSRIDWMMTATSKQKRERDKLVWLQSQPTATQLRRAHPLSLPPPPPRTSHLLNEPHVKTSLTAGISSKYALHNWGYTCRETTIKRADRSICSYYHTQYIWPHLG